MFEIFIALFGSLFLISKYSSDKTQQNNRDVAFKAENKIRETYKTGRTIEWRDKYLATFNNDLDEWYKDIKKNLEHAFKNCGIKDFEVFMPEVAPGSATGDEALAVGINSDLATQLFMARNGVLLSTTRLEIPPPNGNLYNYTREQKTALRQCFAEELAITLNSHHEHRVKVIKIDNGNGYPRFDFQYLE